MLMSREYIVDDGNVVIDLHGNVFLVSSIVPWTSKLVILPIIMVALMVILSILALIYRRVRRFGKLSDKAVARTSAGPTGSAATGCTVHAPQVSRGKAFEPFKRQRVRTGALCSAAHPRELEIEGNTA